MTCPRTLISLGWRETCGTCSCMFIACVPFLLLLFLFILLLPVLLILFPPFRIHHCLRLFVFAFINELQNTSAASLYPRIDRVMRSQPRQSEPRPPSCLFL